MASTERLMIWALASRRWLKSSGSSRLILRVMIQVVGSGDESRSDCSKGWAGRLTADEVKLGDYPDSVRGHG